MWSVGLPPLLELQRSFSAALLSESALDVGRDILEDSFCAAERLQIYRNTCRSTLVAALRMTYPAIDRLVGSAFFDALDRKSTRLNSSHEWISRMPSSA